MLFYVFYILLVANFFEKAHAMAQQNSKLFICCFPTIGLVCFCLKKCVPEYSIVDLAVMKSYKRLYTCILAGFSESYIYHRYFEETYCEVIAFESHFVLLIQLSLSQNPCHNTIFSFGQGQTSLL